MKKVRKGLYNLVLTVLLGIVMILTVSCGNKENTETITQEENQEIAEATKPVDEVEVEEAAKKQWKDAEKLKDELDKKDEASFVYDKTKKEEYQVKIKAEYMEDYGEVDFNKNGIFLTVFKPVKGEEVPDIETYDLLEEYSYYISGSTEYRDSYKVVGNKAYKIEFADGSFGIAFLFKFEDDIFPAVVRFGNVVTGINNNVIVPKLQIVKFKADGEEYFAPNEYLIDKISVKGKNLTIFYADGTKETWQTALDDNEEKSYYLKKIK